MVHPSGAWASEGTLTAILPCDDLDASEAFYALLGFICPSDGRHEGYRLLKNARGGGLHLTAAVEGWLIPGRNPFGLYLYVEDVDGAVAKVRERLIHPPKAQPWGMYECALSDPDETLVRIGWPTRARSAEA